MAKDEIFAKLKGILVSEFEIEEDAITPEATLFDDLELDSIDSIDLIQKMKEFMPAGILQMQQLECSSSMSSLYMSCMSSKSSSLS